MNTTTFFTIWTTLSTVDITPIFFICVISALVFYFFSISSDLIQIINNSKVNFNIETAQRMLNIDLIIMTYLLIHSIEATPSNQIFFFFYSNTAEIFFNETSLFFSFINVFVFCLVIMLYKHSKLDFNNQGQLVYIEQKQKQWQDQCFIITIITLYSIISFIFITLNILIFFIFFELSVLPLVYLIANFSKRTNKFRAKIYLIFFTLCSGVPFLFFILWFFAISSSINMLIISKQINLNIIAQEISITELTFSFIGFFIPFIVKGAIFPFHGWLPEAHVEASTEGSIILSGILLKLGFFGLLRFHSLFFGSIFTKFSIGYFFLFIIGIIPATAALFTTFDLKRVIAFYSVVHMHLGLLGILAANSLAIEASIFINFSHALTSAGLFSVVGIFFEKVRSRYFTEVSGIGITIPIWSIIFFVLLLSNAGIPGTVSFIPELALIVGLFDLFPLETIFIFIWASIAAVRSFLMFNQLVLSSVLVNCKKFFDESKNFSYILWGNKTIEIDREEILSIKCIAAIVLFFGIFSSPMISTFPKFFLNFLKCLK